MAAMWTPGLCLEWKNLNYHVPAKEQNNYSFWQSCQKQTEIHLLKDVSGHMRSGDLVALLGCSGSGKTTLLAAISQRLRGNLSGDVVLNGVTMERAQMIAISSFLPQFDINVRTFTAYEHLYFMSHFKMHRSASKAEKRQRVADLLLAVGLRDVSHTRIQHLSGGERKRLSLAEELITDPPFLFCDEPTTGLDSYSAYTVVRTLRHLCTRQRTIKHSLSSIYGTEAAFAVPCVETTSHSIEMGLLGRMTDLPALSALNNSPNGRHKKAVLCSIHQPTSDIFELFTHIILMDAGRIIYQGPSQQAVTFFTELGYVLPKNCNPADFYLKTIADSHTHGRDGELVRAKYLHQTSGLYSGSWLLPRVPCPVGYLDSVKNFKRIRWPHQVYLLLKRSVTDDLRNLREGLVGLAIFMITSFTLTIMYSGLSSGLTQTSVQDIGGSLFMLSSEMIFTFAYGVTYVLPSALPIMRREVGEGTYTLSAYYVAVVLSFLPLAFLKTFLFLSVVYGTIFYWRGFALYLSLGFVLSLSSVAAIGYGLFISSLFESDYMATECAAPFDLLFLIFGGVYYNVDSLPLLKYTSLFFYSNEALMYDFWIDIDEISCPTNLEHPCIRNGTEVLQRRSFRTADYTYWADCFGLLAITAVFHCFAYCLIRKYVKRSGYY